MNKKNLIIGTIGGVLLLVVVIFGISIFAKKSDSSDKLFWDYPESKRRYIDMCKTDSCNIRKKAQFLELELKNENKTMQKYVDKINKDTIKYYEMVQESDMSSDSCAKYKDKYLHSKMVDTHYENFENDDYMSISVLRTITDLCNGSSETLKPEVYLYNKKTKKIESQIEFMKKKNVFEEQVLSGINFAIDDINKFENKNIEHREILDEYILGYAFDGALYVYFYLPELKSYQTGVVFSAEN